MQLDITVRNMGPESTAEMIRHCARLAEDAGVDALWVADHIAIPPDDAEGSNGRYLDPLATLAFLAAATTRIGLGVGVLVLPYRPPLPTAKWLATIQELSDGRLLFGAGVGWMAPEFRAVGVDRRRRGAIADETLAILARCFAADEVELNGQRFLFRPRPARPPILVGGAPPHALRRAARYGDGWMPMGMPPDELGPHVAALRRLMAEAGKPEPQVAVLTRLPVDDPPAARAVLEAYAAAGATRLIHGARYRDTTEYHRHVNALATLRAGLGT
ncbi:TIGR03619 family F420-dependent LLM class oxidoreductase [bacterium]|nr:TIGR03619 family F420-dependent LLM class oxidoreductase [bacterium]